MCSCLCLKNYPIKIQAIFDSWKWSKRRSESNKKWIRKSLFSRNGIKKDWWQMDQKGPRSLYGKTTCLYLINPFLIHLQIANCHPWRSGRWPWFMVLIHFSFDLDLLLIQKFWTKTVIRFLAAKSISHAHCGSKIDSYKHFWVYQKSVLLK